MAIMPVMEKVGLQLLLEPQASGLLMRAACNVTGVLYPAYQSFKAIEDRKNQAAGEQWLTYWTIYGLFSLLEGSTDDLLGKMPYYYHAKFVALLLLQLPSTQGARLVYTKYLRQWLLKYQPKIDVVLEKVGEVVGTVLAIYKIPIQQATALTMYALSQAVAFTKWFLDTGSSPPPGDGSKPGSDIKDQGPPKKAAQFMTR